MTGGPLAQRIGEWLALVFACLALALAVGFRATPCTALVALPKPRFDVTTLPISANAGRREDRETWFGPRRFNQEIGPFRLACVTTSDGHYWDYDHCLLEAHKCASEPIDLEGEYGLFANLVVLHVMPDGTFVLADAQAGGSHAYAAFRAEPTGRRSGLLPVAVALFALVLVAFGRMARRREGFETKAFVLIALSGAMSFVVIASVLARA